MLALGNIVSIECVSLQPSIMIVFRTKDAFIIFEYIFEYVLKSLKKM